jgi:hypothetical protein
LPPWPETPWQPAQLSDQTAWPALMVAAGDAPPVVSSACVVPLPLPGAAPGPSCRSARTARRRHLAASPSASCRRRAASQFYYSFHFVGRTAWQVKHGSVQGAGQSGVFNVKLKKSFSGGEAG